MGGKIVRIPEEVAQLLDKMKKDGHGLPFTVLVSLAISYAYKNQKEVYGKMLLNEGIQNDNKVY